jgi:hypothetical protein
VLGEIAIFPQSSAEVVISPVSVDDDWPATVPQKSVSVEPWELMVGDVAKKVGVDELFQKTGIRSVLSTKYFVVLGSVLICLLVVILILLVAILVSITH